VPKGVKGQGGEYASAQDTRCAAAPRAHKDRIISPENGVFERRETWARALHSTGAMGRLLTLAAIITSCAVWADPSHAAPRKTVSASETNGEALSGFEFDALKVSVRESPASRRLSALERSAGGAHFASAQAGELMAAFPAGERLSFLKWVRSRLVDPDKALTLCERFSPAERHRAREILGGTVVAAAPE
jgi:hypothetical protein